MGLGDPLRQTLLAVVGMAWAYPANPIASSKVSVAAACAAISPVNGNAKGTGPTT